MSRIRAHVQEPVGVRVVADRCYLFVSGMEEYIFYLYNVNVFEKAMSSEHGTGTTQTCLVI